MPTSASAAAAAPHPLLGGLRQFGPPRPGRRPVRPLRRPARRHRPAPLHRLRRTARHPALQPVQPLPPCPPGPGAGPGAAGRALPRRRRQPGGGVRRAARHPHRHPARRLRRGRERLRAGRRPRGPVRGLPRELDRVPGEAGRVRPRLRGPAKHPGAVLADDRPLPGLSRSGRGRSSVRTALPRLGPTATGPAAAHGGLLAALQRGAVRGRVRRRVGGSCGRRRRTLTTTTAPQGRTARRPTAQPQTRPHTPGPGERSRQRGLSDFPLPLTGALTCGNVGTARRGPGYLRW